MRTINISNEKQRDAVVSMESKKSPRKVSFVLQDGSTPFNIKFLKAPIDVDPEILLKKYKTPEALGEAIIKEDPEIDPEHTGMIMRSTNRVYLKNDKTVSFKVKLMESVKDPNGEEKEVRTYSPKPANVSSDIPLKWTGKLIPKNQAVKKFVFSRKYQIRHVNGLTFDFLYDMAKTLQEKDSLLFLGAGKTGKEPLVLMEGGSPYRGFLEGRIKGDTYCLMLHLSNMELKEVAYEDK